MKLHELNHVQHAPPYCLAPELFRSLKRGERKENSLNLTYSFGKKKTTMHFSGPEILGVDDMRFLQVIVAFAGLKGKILTSDSTQKIAKQLRANLDFCFSDGEELIFNESMGKLLSELGMTDGGKNIRALKSSLMRMSEVNVTREQGVKKISSRLISYAFDDSKYLWIALSPTVADGILAGGKYSRIEMSEVRALKTDPARLIHQRLCGWIDTGNGRNKNNVNLDTLCEYVWPNQATHEAMKKRRAAVRRALKEISELGWIIDEFAKNKFYITRPAITKKKFKKISTSPGVNE